MAGISRAYKRRGNMVANTGAPVLCLDAGSKISYPGTGTTWTDLSGNGNTGTLTNGPTFNSANGGSIVFDGVNDYVGLTAGLLSGTGDFTVSQWIQGVNSSYGTTFGNYPDGNLELFFGESHFAMWLDNSSAYANAGVHYTGNWCLFTGLRSGTVTQLYKNTTLIKTGSSSADIGGTTTQFRLGTNTIGTERYIGKISTTNVYSRALSAAEISINFELTRGRFGI